LTFTAGFFAFFLARVVSTFDVFADVRASAAVVAVALVASVAFADFTRRARGFFSEVRAPAFALRVRAGVVSGSTISTGVIGGWLSIPTGPL